MASNESTKKKAEPVETVSLRLPKRLKTIFERAARKAGKQLSTYIISAAETSLTGNEPVENDGTTSIDSGAVSAICLKISDIEEAIEHQASVSSDTNIRLARIETALMSLCGIEIIDPTSNQKDPHV